MADSGQKSEAAKREEGILAFWKENRIFEKTLEKKAPAGEFTFYDGPPFATGLPHSGSLLSSVSKDLIPRYKTMRGYRVRRRWGWDTHGLPIESLVEKKIGLKNKKEIIAFGIKKFNETARSMVLEYVDKWKLYVERVGRFVDFDNSYKTMDAPFMESVWWSLKQIHDKGNLYEGKKVLMYCPHDETPLAKAEIAMDNTYKDITEEAVTVKFKVKNPEKHGLPENTYILAWTTTPWTLPGNVALAVGPDIEYVGVEKEGVTYVLAKERAEQVGGSAAGSWKGADLVGIGYEPLFEIPKILASDAKKYQVVPADFVTTTDGTGVVHTAVMYGEDDFRLGQKEGLPMIQLLNANATYNDDAPEFIRGQYIKKAETLIKEDIEGRGLLFSKAVHTHAYPHCYRCGTPLIYNAVSSWFINIQNIKDRMLEENEKITWFPEHLKHGRFKHNLETAPDWTISRNRFWASPLPIWKDAGGKVTVIGSVEELKARTKKNDNTFYVMRHGEAEHNVLGRLSSREGDTASVTPQGKKDVFAAGEKLRSSGITKIYRSPLKRAKETAEVAAEALGISKDSIIVDDRIREFEFGELNGKSCEEFVAFRSTHAFDEKIPGGESYQDVKNRFGEFLYEINGREKKETILIVTHGVGFEMLGAVAQGADKEASRGLIATLFARNSEVRKIDFTPIPHNDDFELDLHLPYIDEVTLEDEAGKPLKRIPEVVDCWVESGAMPFAEYHYPFEHKKEFESRTPGDFISEYIGQTRAWFYYLHAMGVSLFDRHAFRNVITTGNVNAKDGAKLSKSKQNYTDPYILFDTYGADAFRYYLMSSVVMQAEDLMFRDEEVKEAANRVVNILRNTFAFYEMYKDASVPQATNSTHIMDRWILARLDAVTAATTDALEGYDVTRATRPLREFIEDFSTWYTRRSRDRMKGGGEDARRALATMRYTLHTFSRLIAPVMPFIAEEIFQGVKEVNDPESVHLAVWPQEKKSFLSAAGFGKNSTRLIDDMARVRALASEALQLRQKANIIVRQPLASLSIPGELSAELSSLLADEVNVKKILTNAAAVALDTNLTPELITEGDERAFLRAVAEVRKELGLSPKDTVKITRGDGPHSVELSTGKVAFSVTPDAA